MSRYHDIENCSLKNGTGCRVVLWFSGCPHHCRGCHNAVTWDENDGLMFDERAEDELFGLLSYRYIEGLTLSGGDPLAPYNRDVSYELLKKCRTMLPDKNVWIYTGYTWEEIESDETLKRCAYLADVVCEGRFDIDKRDVDLHWVGSLNQRVISVAETIREKSIILYTDEERNR